MTTNNEQTILQALKTLTNKVSVLDDKVSALEHNQQELKSDIRHTQNVLLAVMLAIFFFLGGIMWFTRGDVSDLKADVHILKNQHAVKHP